MNNLDKKYFDLLNHILENGRTKGDRTGTGTKSIFDYTIRHKMSEGFPMLTSKKVYFKGVVHELLWFLRGDTNIKYLIDNDVNIWNGDAYKNYSIYQETHNTLTHGEFVASIKRGNKSILHWAELGPVYGAQWRNWGGRREATNQEYVEKGIDQISNLINDLRNNPDSRRLIVSSWNVERLSSMVLPPCHYLFQCYTSEMSLDERIDYWCDLHKKDKSFVEKLNDEKLDKLGVPKRTISLKFSQRSVDCGLGLPFNLASYGLLLQMLANEVNMVPDELIFSGGDCHIYLNHIEGIKKQFQQETFDLPSIEISKKSLFDIEFSDIKLIGYKSSEKVSMPLSN
jgi:thymidylate synthase